MILSFMAWSSLLLMTVSTIAGAAILALYSREPRGELPHSFWIFAALAVFLCWQVYVWFPFSLGGWR